MNLIKLVVLSFLLTNVINCNTDKTTYKYDAQGNQIETITYDAKGNQIAI